VAGFHVLEAADGPEALAYCAEEDPDVLFTDIQLPGDVDGWDVARKCRESHPTLPVLYATAARLDIMKAVPGSTLFQKPYTPDQLVGVVQALTRRN
jgi:CheY-like chemotaxis protein